MPGKLRRDFWQAVVDPRPPRLLDLATMQLVEEGDPLVTEQPERFLKIPDGGPGFQGPLLLAFVQRQAASLPERAREELLADLADVAPRSPEGMTSAVALLDKAGLGEPWRAALEGEILREVCRWIETHRLPEEPFFEGKIKPDRPQESDQEGQLRSWLHQVLDELSLGEMLDLRVPARFFLRPPGAHRGE